MVKYDLTYADEELGKDVTLSLTEGDLRDWLEAWPGYTQPVVIQIQKIETMEQESLEESVFAALRDEGYEAHRASDLAKAIIRRVES